jgi:nucleoside-diphosphate-sugar epimerase
MLPKSIFITGASGFIGSNLIKELLVHDCYKIYAIISGRNPVSFPSPVITVKIDLLDENEVRNIFNQYRPEVLIHLVWDQNTPSFFNSPDNYVWLELSLRLLRLFHLSGGKEFIFAGSSAQYDNDNGLRKEYGDISARSLYGECKHALEDLAAILCSKSSMRFVSCRLFTIFGKGDTHITTGALPVAMRAFMCGEVFVCRNPNAYRDYIHIDDVSRAILAVLESDYSGPVNIASGIPRRMQDIFAFIAKTMRSDYLLRIDNSDANSGVLVADTTVLREKIGYQCTVDFEKALAEEINWLCTPTIKDQRAVSQ